MVFNSLIINHLTFLICTLCSYIYIYIYIYIISLPKGINIALIKQVCFVFYTLMGSVALYWYNVKRSKTIRFCTWSIEINNWMWHIHRSFQPHRYSLPSLRVTFNLTDGNCMIERMGNTSVHLPWKIHMGCTIDLFIQTFMTIWWYSIAHHKPMGGQLDCFSDFS